MGLTSATCCTPSQPRIATSTDGTTSATSDATVVSRVRASPTARTRASTPATPIRKPFMTAWETKRTNAQPQEAEEHQQRHTPR
jgi:hypothetical protein